MTLDISDALSRGIDHTFSDAGAKTIGVFALLNLIIFQVVAGVSQYQLEQQGATTTELDMMMGSLFGPINPIVAIIFIFIVGIGMLLFRMGAFRAFVSDGPDELTTERVTGNFLWVLVNLFIAAILVGILQTIGFMLLIIPGFFVLVSLIFFDIFIIVEGENAIEALRSSWGLTSGERIPLFVIGVIVWLVITILPLIGLLFGFGILGQIMFCLLGSLADVFRIATQSSAYELLVAESEQTEATI